MASEQHGTLARKRRGVLDGKNPEPTPTRLRVTPEVPLTTRRGSG
jgi:hypothetical protein